ncbi:MAG: hypothetical protein MN733_33980 [Nitrososphaera sp.]|nr:hypothetical protein [Nitrososphaera sp.]
MYRWIIEPEIIGRLNDAGLRDVATFLERFNKWNESSEGIFGPEMEAVLSAFDHLVAKEMLLDDLEKSDDIEMLLDDLDDIT